MSVACLTSPAMRGSASSGSIPATRTQPAVWKRTMSSGDTSHISDSGINVFLSSPRGDGSR
eukprot:4283289-Prymnesium_polylepis.2